MSWEKEILHPIEVRRAHIIRYLAYMIPYGAWGGVVVNALRY